MLVAVAPPLLADLVTERLTREPGLLVTQTVSTARDLASTPRSDRPDVICLDPRLVATSVSAFVRAIDGVERDPRLVVLTGPLSDLYVPDAIRAGCSCFASTDRGAAELVNAVRDAAAGQPHMDEAFLQRFSAQLDSGADTPPTALTEREREVLTLAAEGLTARVMAEQLGLSVNTVRHHMQNVLTKLSAHTKLEAISAAVRHGLIPPRT